MALLNFDATLFEPWTIETTKPFPVQTTIVPSLPFPVATITADVPISALILDPIERRRERSRKHYEANKERIIARQMKRYNAKKDEINGRIRQRYANNPEAKEAKSEQGKEWYANNKQHKLTHNKEWAKSNRDRIRDIERKHNRKKLYGITNEHYNAMLAEQDNKCAICSREFGTTHLSKAHIDHCHNTGIIRALLCGACNNAIGLLQDSAIIIDKAAAYIRKYRSDDGWSKGFRPDYIGPITDRR